MLQTISWTEFLSFLFLGLVFYYGYVIWRFGMLREWLAGRGRLSAAADSRAGVGADAAQAVAVGQERTRGEAQAAPQAELISETPAEMQAVIVAQTDGSMVPLLSPGKGIETSDALSTGKPVSLYGVQIPLGLAGEGDHAAVPAAEISPELFRQVEGVMGQVQDLINEAAATQLGRSEFESRISSLLAGHRVLWGTAGQVGIDNFLERCCRVQLSFSLTQQEIGGLWGVSGGTEAG